MADSYNPLMDINTSFCDYLVARTRSYQEHVVGGTLDYAFDADFAMRQKIGGAFTRLSSAAISPTASRDISRAATAQAPCSMPRRMRLQKNAARGFR